MERKSLSNIINISSSSGYAHTHKWLKFHSCGLLLYQHNLELYLQSCKLPTCNLLLVFSWWQPVWPKGVIAAESVSGRDWSLAIHSLCGHEQFPTSLYLTFPTDNSRKGYYSQGNCKLFIRASRTFAVEHLVETWWLQ